MKWISAQLMGQRFLLATVILFAGCEVAGPGSRGAVPAGGPVMIENADANLAFGSQQLARALARIPPAARNRVPVEARADLFERFLLQELVFAEGMRAGLDQDPVIQEKLANYLRQLIEERVLADLALAVEVSDEAVGEYYRENRGEFSTRKVRARHILFEDRAVAEEVRREVLATPDRFPEIAREYSKDRSSAASGGDLGFFGYGKMSPEFEDAAFGLEGPLSISEVVESPSGFHIIQLTDFRPGRERSLEEVQAKVRKHLERRAVDAAREEFFVQLRESTDVSMDPDAMAEAFRIAKSREVPEQSGMGAH
jgi:peptidyl-prolyl cis-trans isomerase C